MKKTIEEFSKFILTEKNFSLSTQNAYIKDLERFASVSGKLVRARKKDIEAYITYMRSEGKSDSTISRSLSSLRLFYYYLESTGKIKTNPVKNIEKPKVERKIPEILTVEEVDKLLSMPDTASNKGLRDKAMLELLYASGIKISEIINLNVYDANLRNSSLFCRMRKIPIGKKAVSALSAYLKKARPQMVSTKNETALFINLDGKRMSRQGFWKIIKYYNELAKIKKEITPQMLRHSFASHLFENGADLGTIQTLMGLADPASTLIYTKMRENKIADTYKKAHPRA